MDQKHTPEPWVLKECEYDKGNYQIPDVVFADREGNVYIYEDDARRIVACVNACAGIPVEQLEAYPAAVMRVMKERDQLLAAVKSAKESLEIEGYYSPSPVIVEIDAAIAAVEQTAVAPVTDAGGWIEWKGGECPVKPGQKFVVRMRSGEEFTGNVFPAWDWRDCGETDDIIAYRVVEGGAA